jgi:hypothetical protein
MAGTVESLAAVSGPSGTPTENPMREEGTESETIFETSLNYASR